jgi:hypothetical protein
MRSRVLRIVATLLVAGAVAYAFWRPGLRIEDGRHDLLRNGAWMQHGWLGDDGWFERNHKQTLRDQFHSSEHIAEVATLLRSHHVRDVFPHLCPSSKSGEIAPADDAQVERFLDGFADFRVMPWIGGVYDESAQVHDANWRASFVRSAAELLERHPRLVGVHLNIEPCPSGDRDYLALLDALRNALPQGKLLSVAAYPPPTVFQPSSEVHWDEDYFREVARRSDQLAVMLYDTSLRSPKLYRRLMESWTVEVLRWSGATPVLLGLPAYDDDVGYHVPEVENIDVALSGIHAGLGEREPWPSNYQGVAVYAEWTMDPLKWQSLRRDFERP